MIAFIKKSLELKIILALIIVIGCIIGIFTVVDIRMMNREIIAISGQGLRALAASIKGSVNAAMQNRHQKEVQRILEEVRMPEVIDRILIYDEQGKALRSAGDGRDIPVSGIRIHPSVAGAVMGSDQTVIDEGNDALYLSYYSPIFNRPACFRCHGARKKLNGILRIDFSLRAVEKHVSVHRRSMIIGTAAMIATLAAALVFLLRIVVHRPVRELRDAMRSAESGSESLNLPIEGEDELSDLKRSFVSMLDRISALHKTNIDKEKEIVRSQEAIRLRAELQAMFDAMPDGVMLVDPELNIVQSNPRAYEMLPRLKEAGSRIPPDSIMEESCPHHGIRKAFINKRPCEHQCSIKLPDGGERHVHSVCAPIVEDGRVAYVVEVVRDISERVRTERELEDKTAELLSANRLLSRIAITDSTTQAYNRRYFDEILFKEIKRYARRKYSSLSLLMIDIDHFKKLNDRYGHLAGDSVLRELAKLIKEVIRETDTLARYGGEEFAIVMPDTNIDGAAYKAEVIRKKVQDREFPAQGGAIKTTISIGVAAYKSGSPYDLIDRADQALYQAKRSGRNMVAAQRQEGAGEK